MGLNKSNGLNFGSNEDNGGGGGGGDRYQKVDYIESGGAAWCLLDVKPDDTLKIRIKFKMKAAGGGSFIGTTNFRFFCVSFSTTYLDYGGEGSNRISASFVTSNSTIYNVELGNLYMKDLDTDTVIVQGTPVSFSELSGKLKLFSNVDYGSVYSIQIEKGGETVKDYIAVLDTKTNIYGLYDKVTETFVPSAGDADFTGGNE
jgi:hypothetical protein